MSRNRDRARSRGATASSPPFLPTNIAGLVAWWRGDSGVTNASGKCSAWLDSIGNVSAVQATASQQPVITASSAKLGGKPALTFASANVTLLAATLAVAAPYTVVLVHAWSIAPLRERNPVGGVSGGAWAVGANSTGAWWYLTIGGVVANSAVVVDTNAHAVAGVFVSGADRLNVDASGTNIIATADAPGAISDIGIGGPSTSLGSPWCFDGDIGDLMIYNSALTAAQVASLFTRYVTPRYGIATS